MTRFWYDFHEWGPGIRVMYFLAVELLRQQSALAVISDEIFGHKVDRVPEKGMIKGGAAFSTNFSKPSHFPGVWVCCMRLRSRSLFAIALPMFLAMNEICQTLTIHDRYLQLVEINVNRGHIRSPLEPLCFFFGWPRDVVFATHPEAIPPPFRKPPDRRVWVGSCLLR